ncbi:MAG: IS5 family transposase [bacterium]|nr:IS5 family transposase [bacterium]MDE0439952.1 IS5 family transposase [bacterium]
MSITQEQYQLLADTFPKPRGNVKVTNLQALNGILYILENGGKWRGLPEEFGRWHTVYMRFSRWAKSGVLTRVFQHLQEEQLIDQAVLGLDSTTVKVHPDATGALRKLGPQAIGRSRGGLTTKIHIVAADARTAIIYALSPGQDNERLRENVGWAAVVGVGGHDAPTVVKSLAGSPGGCGASRGIGWRVGGCGCGLTRVRRYGWDVFRGLGRPGSG